MNDEFDLLIIGGGVNGCGIARDAAGRDLSVLLCDKGDLASVASPAASALLHAGLGFLEDGEFHLTPEIMLEGENLFDRAPHLVTPLRVVLPQRHATQPSPIETSLFIYDYLGRNRQLPESETIDLRAHPLGRPLADPIKAWIEKGFVQSDFWVDDARLAVLNAVNAAENGAEVATRTELVDARREDRVWIANLKSMGTGLTRRVFARALVNVAGPWAQQLRGQLLGPGCRRKLHLARGIHVVLPRLCEGREAYILPVPDGRLIFALPYQEEFSLVGTIETRVTGESPGESPSEAEIENLCEAVNRLFHRSVSPSDVLWSYASVRPLGTGAREDPSAITRDPLLDFDAPAGEAPLLSAFGGGIATYRWLAEKVLEKLWRFFPQMGRSWTWSALLPGGKMPGASFDHLVKDLACAYPELEKSFLNGVARRHGTRSHHVLGNTRRKEDLGQSFGGGLYAREVDYLVREEWARTDEDVLWRRTKCGLHISEAERIALAKYLTGAKGAVKPNRHHDHLLPIM